MREQPDALPFRPITLSDRPRLLPYLRTRRTTCDWTFANLFCWQAPYHMQWAELPHWLVIRCLVDGKRRMGFMVVPDDPARSYADIVPALQEEAARLDSPLLLANLSDAECDALRRQLPDTFAFDRNRDFDDYVYLRQDLAELRGRKYSAKRNHVNKFAKTHTYDFRPLLRQDFAECLRLENEWRGQHNALPEHLTAEQQAIRMAFDNYEALELFGGVLRVDDRIVAFTYGSALNDDTFCTHIEKADIRYEGVYPMINYLFANSLPEKFTFVNREEDMGLPGLRQSKLSYLPTQLAPKHVALGLTEVMRDLAALWQTCFGDEDAFIHSFLTRHYYPDCTFVQRETGRIVSMCFVIPCHTVLGPTAYLYAIATDPNFRGRGYASTLVQRALTTAREHGFTAAMLIPADDGLKGFYQRLGFIDTGVPVAFAGELDLGSGDSTTDIAMVAPLAKDLSINNIDHFLNESCRLLLSPAHTCLLS